MTGFADAHAIGAEIHDVHFGETVRLLPQLSGEATEFVSGGLDPDRPVRDVVGIFDDEPVISRVLGSGANTHDAIDVTTGKSQVEFDAALFPTPDDLPIQGDILALVERPGAPRYAVVSVQPDDTCRVVCLVTALGAAP